MPQSKIRMGGSKLPGLQVNSPKGTGKRIERRDLAEKTGANQGEKRILTDQDKSKVVERENQEEKRIVTDPDKSELTA